MRCGRSGRHPQRCAASFSQPEASEDFENLENLRELVGDLAVFVRVLRLPPITPVGLQLTNRPPSSPYLLKTRECLQTGQALSHPP